MPRRIEEMKFSLNQLRGSVLSIYLNTNSNNQEWKIRLKNGLKKTGEYIQVSNPAQSKHFEKIKKKVEKKIQEHQTSFAKSFVCFGTDDHILLYPLQVPVFNDFQWLTKPATDQLYELFEQYSKSGVILLQNDRVTLLTTRLGELIDERYFEWDIETKNWRQYKGYAVNKYRMGSNHHEKFTRRIKANQERWYKQIVPVIEQSIRKLDWKQIHLAGPPDLTSLMKQILTIPISSETTRNLSGKSALTVIQRTILTS